MEWNGWLEAPSGEENPPAKVVPARTSTNEKRVPKEAYKWDSHKDKRAIYRSEAQKCVMSFPFAHRA